MIQEKDYAKKIHRIRQEYSTRLDKLRLGMNEYVNHMPKELYMEIMKNFSIEKASSYPEVNDAYNALAKYLNQSRERILLTSGADMAIKVVFETFCSNNDIIATCSPTFAMYKIHAELLNCKFEETLSDNEGSFTEEQLLKMLDKNIKLLVLANPNGVTGFCFNKDSIRKLLIESQKKDIIVLIDETYASFDAIDMSEFINDFNNLVIVRSFSKNIGMAGLRIGYILSSEYLVNIMEKFKPMMEINSLAVEAVKTICRNPRYIQEATKEIVKTRSQVAGRFEKMGYKVIERKGNFILVDFGKDRDKIEEKLKQNKVEYKVFKEPLSKYIRFTIGTHEVMEKLLQIINT